MEANIRVFSFLEEPDDNFVERVVERIEFDEEVGFAGFKDRVALAKALQWLVYGRDPQAWHPVKACDVSIECPPLVREEVIRVFLFPALDRFVRERLGGVHGFVPWKNTILMGVTNVPGWKEEFKGVLAHEVAHAVMLRYSERRTLGDHLVYDGIAERFREAVAGRSRLHTIPPDEAKRILEEIRPKLNSWDEAFYRELFFGGGSFPLWAGYAVGYELVKPFIEGRSWEEIFKTPPSDIIRHVL